ncbi:6617_t:CDS:2, partial [Racocetra fulgida]
MIPPLLLDVKPGHWVLDMCAAPGSKTVQIIEAVHANDLQDKTIPSGLVIANDADMKRSCMLVHQAKRLKSPCLIVTNHDAAQFPGVYVNQLAKENGRIVYSTCSMNPLENEAVVAEVLRRSRDVSDQLPQLIRAQGVTSWKVMSKENKWVDKLEDINPKYQKKYEKSLWPPPDTGPITDISSIDSSVSSKNTCDTKDVSIAEANEEIDVSNEQDDAIIDVSVAEANENDNQNSDEEIDISNEQDNAVTVDDPSTNDAVDNYYVIPVKRHNVDSSKHESHKCPKVEKLETETKPDEENDDQETGPQKRAYEEPFIFLDPDYGLTMIYPYLSKKRVVNFNLEDLKILLSEPTPLIDRFDEGIQKRLKEL